MPTNEDFGLDKPEHYGVLTYLDHNNQSQEKAVPSQTVDYSRLYEGVYQSIVHGAPKVVKDEETILLMEILGNGIKGLN